jgi:hypothetical protein
MNPDIKQVSVSDVPGGTTAEAFIVFRQGDMTSRTVCAFCRQEVSEIILTPCCESARRCQERQANTVLSRNATNADAVKP